MIVKEFYCTRDDGVNLYITKSLDGLMIRNVDTDEVFSEAIDIEGATHVYEEIEKEEDDENVEQENINQNDRVRSNAGRRIISR